MAGMNRMWDIMKDYISQNILQLCIRDAKAKVHYGTKKQPIMVPAGPIKTNDHRIGNMIDKITRNSKQVRIKLHLW